MPLSLSVRKALAFLIAAHGNGGVAATVYAKAGIVEIKAECGMHSQEKIALTTEEASALCSALSIFRGVGALERDYTTCIIEALTGAARSAAIQKERAMTETPNAPTHADLYQEVGCKSVDEQRIDDGAEVRGLGNRLLTPWRQTFIRFVDSTYWRVEYRRTSDGIVNDLRNGRGRIEQVWPRQKTVVVFDTKPPAAT